MKKLLIILICVVSLNTLLSCGSSNKQDNTTVKQPENTVKQPEKSIWKSVPIADEFGDTLSGKRAIIAQFDGKMSNSAVSDEKLKVLMQYQDGSLVTIFYDYGKEPQAQLPDKTIITIKLKLSNGNVIEMKQFLFKNMMIDMESEKINNKLLNVILTETVPFKIIVDLTQTEYESTIYNFEINPIGLKTLIK